MRQAGYAFRFWVRTRHACANYAESQTFTNRLTPSDTTRIYGSLATDLNHDGWIDLATINEVSADIRVFPNSANGTGLFNAWLQPPTPTLQETSPHQPADFNNDGKTDICEASYATNKVTVVLGNGNGTFQPQTMTNVGMEPAGICVLDVDGDADMDIVNTNHQSNNLSLLINNGNGALLLNTSATVNNQNHSVISNSGTLTNSSGGVINNDVTVTVVEIRGDKVRLGIEAPPDVLVLRDELRPLPSADGVADGEARKVA
jgi:hypothetical protein